MLCISMLHVIHRRLGPARKWDTEHLQALPEEILIVFPIRCIPTLLHISCRVEAALLGRSLRHETTLRCRSMLVPSSMCLARRSDGYRGNSGGNAVGRVGESLHASWNFADAPKEYIPRRRREVLLEGRRRWRSRASKVDSK